MVIKCICADPLEKSNAENILRRVDEIIKKTQISPIRFREPEAVEAATEFMKNAKSMLETIMKLPDC